MGTIVKERVDWLTVERIYVCLLISNHAVTNKRICIERSNRLSTMTMNQPKN